VFLSVELKIEPPLDQVCLNFRVACTDGVVADKFAFEWEQVEE
jgi:hypothetical protein